MPFDNHKSSHPWIDFKLDFARIPATTWFRLGEAMSKCQHLAGVPLLPEVSAELHQVYLAKGILATTAIEGNTMTERQVRERIEGKHDLPPSREYQGAAVDNILKACNELLARVSKGEAIQIDVDTITNFNRDVLQGQDLDKDTVPGEYRKHSVGVGSYRGAPWRDCPELVEQLCAWLSSNLGIEGDLTEEHRFARTVVGAVIAHLYVAWIHPFGDGNGRTARLVEFALLVTQGVPSPAAHLLSNHYNLTRDRYYRELEKSSRGEHGVYGFVTYAIEGFVDGLREQISFVRDQQMKVTWVNYVHAQFAGLKNTETQNRRKLLVLSLPSGVAVPKEGVPDLNGALARAYARKESKTLTRDLNALLKQGLIRRVQGGYAPAEGLVEAFLAVRADAERAVTKGSRSGESR